MGPVKVLQGMAQDYVSGDIIANLKRPAIQFVADKLNIAEEYVEVAGSGIYMGFSFFFAGDSKVVDVAKDVQKSLGKAERKIHKNSLEVRRPKKGDVKPYEVGEYSEMIKRSKTDKLDIHHAPQKHTAKQVIPGYNESKAPSIAVPQHLHRKIKNIKGTYDENPRQLLAKTAKDLRNHTDAPNSAIQELLKKAKNDFPGTFNK